MWIEGLTVNPWKTGGAGYFSPVKKFDPEKAGNPGVNGPYIFPDRVWVPDTPGDTLAVWPRRTSYFSSWGDRVFELTDELFGTRVQNRVIFERIVLERIAYILDLNIGEEEWSGVARFLQLFDAWVFNPETHWARFGPAIMPIDTARWCLKFMSYQDMFTQERAMITGVPGRWEAARRNASNRLYLNADYRSREGILIPPTEAILGTT